MLAHFRSKMERISSERAESLPAAIVTGIVSSIILLGLASVMATIVTQQKDAQITAEATTSATNIDVSLRSDSTAATSITALSAHSVNFHIPSATGNECKLVAWNVDNTSLTRHLSVFAGTTTVNDVVECDTGSALVVSNVRILSDRIEAGSTFAYANALDRSLTVSGPGTMTPSDPAQIAPNNDAATQAAWASTKISKISYAFKIIPETGADVTRSIEQSASTPLYSTPAEKTDAETGLANAATPAQINPVRVSANPIVLGAGYTVSWDAVFCPADTVRSYTLYENGVAQTLTANTTTKTQTNQALATLAYSAITTCVRGALAISGPVSPTVTVDVIPPVPSLGITNKPAITGAAVNANITASATCAYGSPRYSVTNGTVVAPDASTEGFQTVNRAINVNHIVYQGASYTYGVNAWCLTTGSTKSNPVSQSTGAFTTSIAAPAAPTWVSPAAAATKVATTVNADWNAVTCAAGTTTSYYVEKNRQYNAAITAVKVYGGTAATTVSVTNLEGNTVGYAVKALCQGSAINSGYSAATGLTFTTLVTAPSVALSVSNNGWATMTWAAPTTKCATGVTLQYRLYQTKNNNIAGDWATAWGDYLSAVLPVNAANPGASYQGYPHWGYIQTLCNGVNADSSAVGTQATSGSKWVAGMAVSLSGGLSSWRKFSVNASCPVGSTVGTFYMYVAASGWNGTRYNTTIQTDEGANIAASTAGPGGNSGWLRIDQNVNGQWVDDGDSSHYWGYWGQGGYGATYNTGNRTMKGTYWNASAWGTFAWYWTGNCSTPYKVVYDRGGADANTGANKGDPWAHWSHWTNNPRTEQTAAGDTAVQ